MEDMTRLIIIAVVAVILILFSSQLYVSMHEALGDNKCSLKPERCQRKEYVIKDDVITLDGSNVPIMKDGKLTKKYEVNDDAVNFVVAEELYSCWQKMGAGVSYKTFSVSDVIGLDEGTVGCVICSYMNFDSKTPEFKGLGTYLSKNGHTSEETYYTYLTKNLQESHLDFLSDKIDFLARVTTKEMSPYMPDITSFQNNKKYAIYYVQYTPVKNAIGSEYSAYLRLAEFENIQKDCEDLVN